MQVVRFTKYWRGLSIGEMGERAAMLGYDGLDLAVRRGHPINPDNVAGELADAVKQWGSMGVACPMISTETEVVDAKAPMTRTLFEAAGAAGVSGIKIGYFHYNPGDDFDAAFDAARHALEEFEALSARTGVRTLCHTHSGLLIGSNCAGMRQLLAGLDPARVGCYADLGHLALNGEDVLMALPMVRSHLAAIGAKDGRHVRDDRPEARAPYANAFVDLGQGAAAWRDAIRLLRGWGFRGPFSVHTEATVDQRVIAAVGAGEQTAEAETRRGVSELTDLRFLRGLWREAAGAPRTSEPG